MADAAGPDEAAQEDKQSGEGTREQLSQLRSLPVDQLIGDVLFRLLHAAQAKVGRRDARLLIDVTAVAHQHARPYLPALAARAW